MRFLFLIASLVLSFFYSKGQPPVINSFSPASGPAGTVVTITGTNFHPAADSNIVYFGVIRATVVNASATSLSVIAPVSSSNNLVTVTCRHLTASSNVPFRRTFNNGAVTQSIAFDKIQIDSLSRNYTIAFFQADFDSDGKIDLITSEHKSDSFLLAVYRNASSANSFAMASKFYLNVLPPGLETCYQDFTTKDINGDGKPDILCSSKCLQKFLVLLNTSTAGNISFSAAIQIPKANGDFIRSWGNTYDVRNCFRVADIDNDGRYDLVNINDSSGFFFIYRNISNAGGTPQFVHAYTGNAGSAWIWGYCCDVKCLAIADYNNDRLPDISVTRFQSGTFITLQNTSTPGNISFSPSPVTYYQQYLGMADIKIADLDADGNPDVGTTNNFLSYSFSLFRNTGNNTISFAPPVELPISLQDLKLQDLNGDGLADLYLNGAIPNYSGPFVKLNKSTPGNLQFDTTDIRLPGLPSVELNDFDGDNGNDAIGFDNQNRLNFYKRIPKPLIYSINPTEGLPGTSVQLKGMFLNGATSVKFGRSEATSFIVTSDTTITAIVGSGNTGVISVTSSFGSDVSADTFFMTLPPTIISFTPDTATDHNGVTIRGRNFARTNAVSFGGIAADTFYIMSDTVIIATVGNGSSGNVIISNPYGDDTLQGFVYMQPAASLSGITFTPLSGPVGSLVTINLTAGNFSPGLPYIVYFGGVKAEVVSINNSSIIAKAPAGADNMPVSVTTNSGLTYYSTLPFTITFNGTPLSSSSFDTVKVFTGITGQATDGSNLASGDIDGDGRPDIVSANGKISIFRTYGPPGTVSLLPKIDIPAEDYQTDIHLIDFDGDGKLDIITAGSSNNICVFRNLSSPGNISFAQRQYFNTGEGASEIACADFDNDGKPDIATANQSEFSVSLLHNTSITGNISFAAQTKYITSNYCKYIAAKDLNGDHLPDIVLNIYNAIITLKNTSSTGNISFLLSADTVSTGTVQDYLLYLTDLDTDTKPDLLSHSLLPFISTFKNSSTASNISFDNQIDYSINNFGNATSVTASDFNGDGKLDPISAYYSGVRIIENASTAGTIEFSNNFLLPDNLQFEKPYNAIGCDIDMDGKPDIVSTTFTSLLIFRNKNNEAIKLKLCPSIASTNITSNLSGASYQWQVDIGNEFINVSNNTTYSNVTTNTLSLLNIPSDWYGYKYRCLVDNNYSNITQLKFENIWAGTANPAWENPANWSCGTVPDSNTDVVINSGSIVINSNVTVRTLMVSPGASLTVSTGYTLTVLH
jgi:hypothetical protein